MKKENQLFLLLLCNMFDAERKPAFPFLFSTAIGLGCASVWGLVTIITVMMFNCIRSRFIVFITLLSICWTSFLMRSCYCHTENHAELDLSKVTWAHAVNSRGELEDALNSAIDFLEADISIGQVLGAGPQIPIMAHPPDVTSDISFDQWLDLTISRATGKGIKLDFKSILAVEPTLDTLKRHERKINFPLWLNADILPGPVNSTGTPVPASEFIHQCVTLFPNAVLSVGWTTYWFDTFDPATWYYGWNHVRAMADALECSGFRASSTTSLTFPVRAVFASRSIPQLRWLLDRFPRSTLTVWSGQKDGVDVEDLLKIRRTFSISRVYYDVPEPLRTSFESRKGHATVASNVALNNFEWTSISTDPVDPIHCSPPVYVSRNNLMFSRNSTSAVISTKSFNIGEGSRLTIRGRVHFYSAKEDGTLFVDPEEKHQLVLVLVDESKIISSFSSVNGHNELIYGSEALNVMNASRLHTFEQSFDSMPESCHFFDLDTTAERKFQAWTLPCDMHEEGRTDLEMTEQGTTEVSRNMRLVLPPGPVRFGFISSGDGYVVVHDLEIEGEEKRVADGSENLESSALVIGVLLVSAVIVVM